MASILAVDVAQRIIDALVPAPVRGSALALLTANLLPLYGVLVWDWPVYHLMALYWAENVVAGVFTLLRMLVANPIVGVPLGAFFCVHYGMFCFVHGIFVHSMFGGAPTQDFGVEPLVDTLLGTPTLLAGVLLMVASHGWSFVAHTVLAPPADGRGDLRHIMLRPYGRMVLLHVTILAGGFLTMAVGEPILVLVPLVLFKIAADLALHRRANIPAPPTV